MASSEVPQSDGMLELDAPVTMPDVLDVLIVGAGPAGTAAAFRAKELSLSALVVEHDDVMKRIRDYDKRKPIKPDFGAAKQMGFPTGGSLVAQLQFDEIAKDDMYRSWRGLYQRNSVPVRTGVELSGLERDGDVWRVKVKDHNREDDDVLKARHVVLALGGGMPRALDITGNVEAVSTRLAGVERFVDAAACVVGGGSTAAEAVIAISNAKAAAQDPHPVYWAHRGEKMPKVSEALAPELFRSTSLNGNLRYLLNSDPVAVVKGKDGKDYLRIEVDRKTLPNRPVETVQLEFVASYCLACIGQELPTRLLDGLGISTVVGGPHNRRAFALTPLLETGLGDVYMVGDTLNQMYLECRSFADDPGTFEERAHRGNIKQALTDGVLVAEVIAQKLTGKTDISVVVRSTPPTPAPEATARRPLEPVTSPVEATRPEPPVAAKPTAVLVRLLEGDVEAEQFALAADQVTTVGREACDICFEDDSAMARRHLSIIGRDGGYAVRDETSKGVFLRLTGDHPREIQPGAILKVGEQWLVFGEGADRHSFTHHDATGAVVGRHQLSEGTVIVGRASPDITLSSSDASLSRRHAAIARRGGTVAVRDLRTVNGTYLKVADSMSLEQGDEIRVGHQRLRFMPLQEVPGVARVHHDSTSTRIPVVDRGAAGSAVATALPDGLAVTFQDDGRKCPFGVGQSVCEVAEAAGVDISAECHQGICGSDPIRVVAGQENLNLMSEDERSTLEELCGLDPSRHRLACLTRPTGPVVVSVVKS